MDIFRLYNSIYIFDNCFLFFIHSYPSIFFISSRLYTQLYSPVFRKIFSNIANHRIYQIKYFTPCGIAWNRTFISVHKMYINAILFASSGQMFVSDIRVRECFQCENRLIIHSQTLARDKNEGFAFHITRGSNSKMKIFLYIRRYKIFSRYYPIYFVHWINSLNSKTFLHSNIRRFPPSDVNLCSCCLNMCLLFFFFTLLI